MTDMNRQVLDSTGNNGEVGHNDSSLQIAEVLEEKIIKKQDCIILIANQDENIADSIKEFLSDLGFSEEKIHIAGNYAEALEMFRQINPDMIITGNELRGGESRKGPNLVGEINQICKSNGSRIPVTIGYSVRGAEIFEGSGATLSLDFSKFNENIDQNVQQAFEKNGIKLVD